MQGGRAEYLDLFRTALAHFRPTHIDAAVAYATVRGVIALEQCFLTTNPVLWSSMRKRWLVGIDWFRSDPGALDYLARLPRSSVRTPDGITIVGRRGCTPLLPYHPKTFILRASDGLGIVNGSGNLSRNGLTRGHECGNLILFAGTLTAPERSLRRSVQDVPVWFDRMWRSADPLSGFIADYRQAYESSENMRAPVPTDDDAAPTSRTERTTHHRRGIAPGRLRQLRAASHLWIRFVPNPNRGPGRPGNQLMMSPMTRVFFGFPAIDLPTNTFVGDVRVKYSGYASNCPLRFSDNSMDVPSLPVPGSGGQLAMTMRSSGLRVCPIAHAVFESAHVPMFKRGSAEAGWCRAASG